MLGGWFTSATDFALCITASLVTDMVRRSLIEPREVQTRGNNESSFKPRVR